MSEPETPRAHTFLPSAAPSADGAPVPETLGVVGRGRVGTALAAAFGAAGLRVSGPAGRGESPAGEAVLLCVPDAEIAAAAEVVAAHGEARLVGHVSGASGLSVLAAAEHAGAEVFSLHPLQTFSGTHAPSLAGAGCAVTGSSPAATAVAAALARRLGLRPFEVGDERRTSYHAAASIASNFLVTLQSAAEAVAAGVGLEAEEARALLAPLVRQTVENWAIAGPQRALTGPVARGDERTVEAQRAAVAAVEPGLIPLFDVLVEQTRRLAGTGPGARHPSGGHPPGARGARGGASDRAAVRGLGMRTVRTVSELRSALAAAPRPVALVPTMGALHDGHLSLIEHAREHASTVVVSAFVNPTQFSAGEDLARYPRDERRDAELASAAGADILFVPAVEEVYPAGFDTAVEVGGPAAELEGDPAHRGPGHFRGVATVVAKLFNMVGPDVALFGQKDAQQALVIRRLVRDLDFPVRIETVPTVRDEAGLALSSRNAHLSAAERERALALSRALRAAEARVGAGEVQADAVLAAARAELDGAGLEPDYLELRSAQDLSPAARVDGATLLCVAARVGTTRLIDNVVLRAEPAEAILDLQGAQA